MVLGHDVKVLGYDVKLLVLGHGFQGVLGLMA